MPHPTPTLVGLHVRLEPLTPDHVPALVDAAADRTSFGFTEVPRNEAEMRAYVARLTGEAELGLVIPFAQVSAATGRAVGCTRYMEIRRVGDRIVEVEVGGTWLATDVQRTAVNSEAKLLLLTHAFEVIGVDRVAIATDERNQRSRAAIERLGASLDGILRNHRRGVGDLVEEGVPRNTAVYSLVPDEWPGVKAFLQGRLGRDGGGRPVDAPGPTGTPPGGTGH